MINIDVALIKIRHLRDLLKMITTYSSIVNEYK